ncbi:MAG: 2-oxoacid:ferredoxin oxidoreductase subunit beta [Deltaproteobacteria bacterium]|nr:2-oxoacid:ferredoxin oxidoreductase subunit beta [Deltaproteobacteria bacterium]
MVSFEGYGNYETAWCPGCGNHAILEALKKALVTAELLPYRVLIVSGIGQAAKSPHYLNVNFFNGLHGRALPAATGAKLANPDLNVIVESGDGCNYGEGGNHFLAAIRRNIDVTLLVHNNQVYGLTKGQASPTTAEGVVTKAQPAGVPSIPFNPVAVATAMQAGFVARGFSGKVDHLADLIVKAMAHPGFALVDIMQPCVSFNKVNTFAWYKQRCQPVSEDHDPANWEQAMKVAFTWGEQIPIGVIYHNQRPAFETHFSALKRGPLIKQPVNTTKLAGILESFA